MEKVFVVVSYFSDSNSHESSSRIICVTLSKVSADKLVSRLKESHIGFRFEVVGSDFYE